MSNVTELIELIHGVSSILNGKAQVEVIIHFCKALDKVNHRKLNLTLEEIFKNQEITSLIRRFSHERKPLVSIEGSNSQFRNVKSGVAQASVLGPLFSVFINDDLEGIDVTLDYSLMIVSCTLK